VVEIRCPKTGEKLILGRGDYDADPAQYVLWGTEPKEATDPGKPTAEADEVNDQDSDPGDEAASEALVNAVPPGTTPEAMTVRQLRALAKIKGVVIPVTVRTKDELIALLSA
jgi:hypothetical protein